MEKIKEIILYERNNKNSTSFDKISIEENGRINLFSYDIGALPAAFFGKDECEYNIYVEPEWKDSVLLLLLKETFKKNTDFRNWADKKGIPYSTVLW